MKKSNSRMSKGMVLFLALMMLVAVAVGATVAYLLDKSTTITNTFTPTNVGVTLAETTGTSYGMIPGTTIAKDPQVTVTNDVDCYVFVKAEKSANFDTFMTYEMATGWTPLSGVTGVYYREVAANAGTKTFPVIKDNTVTVPATVKQSDMNTLKGENAAANPTLTFTAYVVQKSIGSAAEAWDAAQVAANY